MYIFPKYEKVRDGVWTDSGGKLRQLRLMPNFLPLILSGDDPVTRYIGLQKSQLTRS